MTIVPSFLRVMQAEQTMSDNFVYETEEQLIISSLHQQRRNVASRGQRLDESDEIDGDIESSIPEESSIAISVAIQNQRRATGTLNAG